MMMSAWSKRTKSLEKTKLIRDKFDVVVDEWYLNMSSSDDKRLDVSYNQSIYLLATQLLQMTCVK